LKFSIVIVALAIFARLLVMNVWMLKKTIENCPVCLLQQNWFTCFSGINSINVAIHDALFKRYPDVTKYQVSVTATTSSGVTGTAYTTFIINVPPSGGTCSITPNIGTVLQTTFDINCSGWSDSDGITEYQTYCMYLYVH
jgi:hypothetical protein